LGSGDHHDAMDGGQIDGVEVHLAGEGRVEGDAV
jgi:hypothetical protein